MNKMVRRRETPKARENPGQKGCKEEERKKEKRGRGGTWKDRRQGRRERQNG